MARRFDDLICWITGGGSGLGAALACELAARGGVVVVSGRREGPLQEVVGRIEAAGGRAEALPLDVTDEDAVREAAAAIVARHGRLDVAVANAGYAVSGRVEKLCAADLRRQLDVNVIGVLNTATAALPHLRESRGRLGLVGSVIVYAPAPGNGAYAASKAAVHALGQTLSVELKGSGVSCTTIHPGFVESDIARVDNQGVYHPDRKDPRPAQLMWTADAAARSMADGLHKRKREHVFTGHGKVAAFLGRHFPGLMALLLSQGKR
ncbi:MAG: SDR family NAD(P)-dependent oxidoreductase [Alphaproteobacteria bacterium]|nr:SDR family NAD(P)-dependent oxidoreductase [Alphaproteobacteria bacterium]